jgi:hypothetical protein
MEPITKARRDIWYSLVMDRKIFLKINVCELVAVSSPHQQGASHHITVTFPSSA